MFAGFQSAGGDRSISANYCGTFHLFRSGRSGGQGIAQSGRQGGGTGHRFVTVSVLGEEIQFDVDQILTCAGDIHGQIYARDFKFIEQSDMIISYIPCDENGKPILSSGVERELQHAHESAREAYVIWTAQIEPSPFITETATRVFSNLDQAMEFFVAQKYIKSYQREL